MSCNKNMLTTKQWIKSRAIKGSKIKKAEK